MKCRCSIAEDTRDITDIGDVFTCDEHGNYVFWPGRWCREIPLWAEGVSAVEAQTATTAQGQPRPA